MVAEIRPDYGSQWAAICAVAGKLGIGAPETVRTWVRRAEVDDGKRPGMTTEQAAYVPNHPNGQPQATPQPGGQWTILATVRGGLIWLTIGGGSAANVRRVVAWARTRAVGGP
jgi:hypothetical protein